MTLSDKLAQIGVAALAVVGTIWMFSPAGGVPTPNGDLAQAGTMIFAGIGLTVASIAILRQKTQ